MSEIDPVVTTTMFTDAERAAWEVAVQRGLRIEAADLRAVLEAAAPLLAEAWGVTGVPEGRKPGGTRDPRARTPCRRCGAEPGQQCVTSSGTRAPLPHAERRNDWRRTEGQMAGLELEGIHLDRFPPRPS